MKTSETIYIIVVGPFVLLAFLLYIPFALAEELIRKYPLHSLFMFIAVVVWLSR